jgi:hypothetical protein
MLRRRKCVWRELWKALMRKLNPRERLLFSARWRGTTMGDTITRHAYVTQATTTNTAGTWFLQQLLGIIATHHLKTKEKGESVAVMWRGTCTYETRTYAEQV